MGNAYAKIFTTPVGRVVNGNLYKPNTTDLQGKPLVFKSGPKMGQTGREDFYFAIAVPKGVERHWAETEWGAQIWAVGHAAKPNAGQGAFSWKVSDGDDATADDKGRRPCDRPGFARHWILNMSSGFPTKIFKQREGSNPAVWDPYTVVDAVKPGYFVQVQINCDYNGSQAQPGVYLNHNMVAFIAFGDEIALGGADPSSANFGGAPLPAGATMAPPANFNPGANGAPPPPPGAAGMAPPPPPPLVAGMAPPPPPPPPPAAVAAPVSGLVRVPGAAHTIEQCRAGGWTDDQIVGAGIATRVAAPLPPVGSAPPPPPPAPIASVPGVTPNAGYMAVPPPPGAAAAPPPPPPPPAAPVRHMLPAAQGATYEQMIARGWNDAQLVQNGMMAA